MNTSLLTSLALKTASMVLIISTIVDVGFTVLPYQLGESAWWAAATGVLVKNGLMPLVGIVFWIASEWIESVSKDSNGRSGGTLSQLITVLSVIFGLLFLLIVPFQTWNGISERDKAIAKTKEQVAGLETQIQNELKILNDKTKIQQQITEWDNQIKGNKLQGTQLESIKAQKTQLEQLIADPAKLKTKSEEAVKGLKKQQQDADNQATGIMWKSGIRNSLSSLLLAAGYSFIGYNGLRRQKR
jgi:predicted PurR-regulated permease PerM